MAKNQSGLPIVKEGVLESFLHDLTSGSYNFSAAYDRMLGDENNPGENRELAFYMERVISKVPRESKSKVFSYMMGIYELLRRQSEADMLEGD